MYLIYILYFYQIDQESAYFTSSYIFTILSSKIYFKTSLYIEVFTYKTSMYIIYIYYKFNESQFCVFPHKIIIKLNGKVPTIPFLHIHHTFQHLSLFSFPS